MFPPAPPLPGPSRRPARPPPAPPSVTTDRRPQHPARGQTGRPSTPTTGGVSASVLEVRRMTHLHRRALVQVPFHTSGTKVHDRHVRRDSSVPSDGTEGRRRGPRLWSPGLAESVRAEVAGCWGHRLVVTRGPCGASYRFRQPKWSPRLVRPGVVALCEGRRRHQMHTVRASSDFDVRAPWCQRCEGRSARTLVGRLPQFGQVFSLEQVGTVRCPIWDSRDGPSAPDGALGRWHKWGT